MSAFPRTVPVGTACFCLLLAGALTTATAAPVVQFTTSVTSPQPLGTTVTLTASATDTDAGLISYRFEVGGTLGSQLYILRDFSVATTFDYTPTDQEGFYEFRVTARNNITQKSTAKTIPIFRFSSLVSGLRPVVTATAHPLVALFSAPSCAAGLYMRVNFVQSGQVVPLYTSFQPCKPPFSMNFLVAGMHANSTYRMNSETWDGTTIRSGVNVSFTTGTPTVTFPTVSLPVYATQLDSLTERVLLISNLSTGNFPMAVDLLGVPVWYYVDPAGLSGAPPNLGRPVAGGNLLLIASGPNSNGAAVGSQHVLREIDLAGNTVRETNTSRVAEQLTAKFGVPSLCQTGSTQCMVGAFHHDAVRLPNGHTLLLADEERVYTDGTQGSSPSNPVDVIGDLILDLDGNFQLAWYWDSFNHLDVSRSATLRETCQLNGGGCPSVFLASVANDWLHSNSLDYSSPDGNILLSMRHQDWVIKIDYANGTGSGNVLWRLGAGGDFTINSTDPYPWFSHQHDPGYELNGTTVLSLFDNGNTRVAQNPNLVENSRGYVLSIDETNMVVTPLVLANLGYYSSALGSAQRLANGDYHFLAGFVNPGPNNHSIEVSPAGTIGFDLQVSGTIAYRSFRMPNLYTPPVK